MSGYRDELDSALRQLKGLREETVRLREELDATRAAGGSSLGQALVAWAHASPRSRALVLLSPLLFVLGGLVLIEAASRLVARPPGAPLGVVVPLVPDARPTPICPPPVCPPQRPCFERHRVVVEENAPPTERGVITAGTWRGFRWVGPSREDTDIMHRFGVLAVRTRGAAMCSIDLIGFNAPRTMRQRPGDYTVRCVLASGRTQNWRTRVEAGMVTELVELPESEDAPVARPPPAPPTGTGGAR